MLLARLRKNGLAKRIAAAAIYAFAALPMGNWLALYYAAQLDAGREVVVSARIAIVGCIILALACLVALLHFSYGAVLGTFGACLCWPYFGVLAMYLPWRDFVWLVTIHFHGWMEVWSIFGLFAATIYSLWQLRAVAQHLRGRP